MVKWVRLFPIFFAMLVVTSRIISILAIHPGNAPDEAAHLYVVNNIAHGHWLSVEDEFKNTRYPYSLYNPLPYFPSALGLNLARIFKPEILETGSPENYKEYSELNVRVARAGQMVWTLLFFLVFWKFINKLQKLLVPNYQVKGFLYLPLILTASLPQLLFVQSYLNLDNMGIFAVFYHLWAILIASPLHFSLSLFLILNAKLNFICVLPFSFLFCFSLIGSKKWSRQWTQYISLSLIASTWWSISLIFIQRSGLKSILGFFILPELFKGENFILSNTSFLHFLQISFLSSYGVFGWVNQFLPKPMYLPFLLFLVLGVVAFYIYFKAAIRVSELHKTRFFLFGALTIILANLGLHIISGFGHSYQPQGRYLLPTLILIYSFGFLWLNTRSFQSKLSSILVIAILIFSGFEIYKSVKTESENPFLMGYGFSNIIIDQHFSHEKTAELLEGDLVVQSFQIRQPIQKIYIRISSFYRKNKSQGVASLSDCGETIFHEENVDFSNITDLADIKIIDLKTAKSFSTSVLCLRLKIIRGEKNHSIALLKSFANTSHLGTLTLNQKELGGDLVFKVF